MMKNLIWTLLTTALFCSCTGKQQSANQQSGDDTAADFRRMRNRLDDADEMGRTTERLKTLAPLSTERMKALLPEEINGYKRTAYKMQPSSVEADYEKSPGVRLHLSVQDCAGEDGAMAYTLRYWSALNAEEENELGYNRPVNLAGFKAIESYKKTGMETELTWFAAGRLLVVLKGEGFHTSVLRQAAEALSFKP